MRILIKLTLLMIITVNLFEGVGSAAAGQEAVNDAVDFQLQDINGNTHRLSSYLEEGKVVLWFTNFCGGCQKALPVINEVFTDNPAELLIISLLSDDTKTPMIISEKYDLAFPVLLDPAGKVCQQYSGNYLEGSCPLNNLFIIDKAGAIIDREHYPGLDKSELDKFLQTTNNQRME